MKKDEAISILATSARPRESKNRTRYDEAVKMAIEALRQPEQRSFSCGQENDLISRQAAKTALSSCTILEWEQLKKCYPMLEVLEELPSAQPEIIRCGECKHWREDHTCGEHSLVSPMMAYEFCSRAERRQDEHIG